MSIFKPNPIQATIREIEKLSNNSYKVAKISGELERCEDYFIGVISDESVNVYKRKKLKMSVKHEKDRIRDAVIGFLAVEEVTLDLASLESDQNIERALRRLQMILIRMNFLSYGSPSMGMGDIYEEMNREMPGSGEPTVMLSARADMVNADFVNKLIDGVLLGTGVKMQIHNLLSSFAEVPDEAPYTTEVDFRQYADEKELDRAVLEKFENMR